MVILIFMGIILLIVAIDYVIFKLTDLNRTRRLIAGAIALFVLPPLAYWTSVSLLMPHDPGGFGTVSVAFLITGLFIINGIIIFISSAFA
ncbi:hypothetical protein FLK61_26495 [Paenalkalicoccus suaedae]|uniref:Uncharacterized protein n=1 Tax=Paenalkalicoccus suaedae TaxID=2592382 RepID=A0A859FC39_9BACI|nr:hypothetical protein [Paenalkalicoccus suaedae]QKS70311.1 hypothetical protein FLK61_26495 [Paenalkalicoccus suaedae]